MNKTDFNERGLPSEAWMTLAWAVTRRNDIDFCAGRWLAADKSFEVTRSPFSHLHYRDVTSDSAQLTGGCEDVMRKGLWNPSPAPREILLLRFFVLEMVTTPVYSSGCSVILTHYDMTKKTALVSTLAMKLGIME